MLKAAVRCVVIGVMSVVLMHIAMAREAHASVPFSVQPLPLFKALNAWARQAKLQLIWSAGDPEEERMSPALVGNYAPEQALTLLLDGSGLEYSFLDEQTVEIRRRGDVPSATERTQASAGVESLRLAQAADAPAAGADTAQGSQSAAAASADLEEIVVTAQKRTERLQDVPISISVLGGEQLDTFTGTGITEALRSVPGIAATVHNQNGGTQMSVRGVAANRALFGGSSPVVYYLDGVPFGFVRSASAPDSSAYDLARVEVLRGPQGTLYGASALNGVVRVLTHDADLDRFDFKARTSVSNTEDGSESYRGDVAANIPIIEGKFAARAVLGYQDIGGWIDKAGNPDANDARIGNYRLRLRAAPTENLSIGLSTWLSRGEYGAPPTSRDDRTSTATIEEPASIDYDVYGLTVGYDFSGFSLNSTTSFLSYENAGVQDLRPISLNSQLSTALSSDVLTQEINLASTSTGSWRWTAGAIYRVGEDELLSILPGIVPTSDTKDRSESYAVFAEVTRLLLDGRLELTAGLRYFKDTVRHSETLPVVYRTEDDFQKTTPRIVLTWKPSDDTAWYASYAEGFRSGQVNFLQVLNANPNFPPVKPDTLRNYELGTKGRLWDGRLRYDSAVYYIDWQDLQMNASVLVNGVFFSALTNGESASGVGVDLSMTAQLIEGLDFGLNIGWNDLASDEDVFVSSAGALRTLIAKGDRLNYSPQTTASAVLDYNWSWGGGFESTFSVGATYMSRQQFHNVAGANRLNYAGESILVGRTSFALDAPRNWRAVLFVDNFTDEDRPLIGATFGNPNNASHVMPRSIGLQLEYRL